MEWLYKGKRVSKCPVGCWGFIYMITNLDGGKIYIGKKQLTHRKRTKLSKKARIGTRKRIKVEHVDSGWLDYWGSSKDLQQDIKNQGEENFQRIILHYCKNKAELSLWEGFYQYKYKVWEVPSYNKWIMLRVYFANLKT